MESIRLNWAITNLLGSNLLFSSYIPRRLNPIRLLEWRECMTTQQKEQVLRLRVSGASYGSIAAALGLSVNTVKSCCKRSSANRLTMPPAVKKNVPGNCSQCGAHLIQTPGHRQKRFCSEKCRMARWAAPEEMKRAATSTVHCEYCGTAFLQYGSRPRKFCSRTCYLAHRYGQGGEARG